MSQKERARPAGLLDSLRAYQDEAPQKAAREIERLDKLIAQAHRLIQGRQYHIAEDILFNRGVRYAKES